MPKEKSINPAQAQHKLDKAKALKKGNYFTLLLVALPPPLLQPQCCSNREKKTGKAEQAARRTEKLARRNPDRLQRQIDELRAAEQASSGKGLNKREKSLLEELERDVKAVRKARETLGEKAPPLGGRGGDGGGGDRGGRREGRGGAGGGGSGTLGKRRRHDDNGHGARRAMTAAQGEESDSSTTESVRGIPMPRDTPPPIPAEFQHLLRSSPSASHATNANLIPLVAPRHTTSRLPHHPHALPAKPSPAALPPAQTVYEAQPVVRDLRKEAVRKFMPAVVRRKIDATKSTGGAGRLVEEEEWEDLQRAGYVTAAATTSTTGGGDEGGDATEQQGEQPEEDEEEALRRLEEEERRFREGA